MFVLVYALGNRSGTLWMIGWVDLETSLDSAAREAFHISAGHSSWYPGHYTIYAIQAPRLSAESVIICCPIEATFLLSKEIGFRNLKCLMRWGEVTVRLTVSQYVLVTSTLVALATRYYFLSECCCLKFAVLHLWAPSLTRGRVCNLQCNHSMILVAQNPYPYFTGSSEILPTWTARFSYLYTPGTGWPSHIPGHWVCLMNFNEDNAVVWMFPFPEFIYNSNLFVNFAKKRNC
jgi:hypothetical protein